jgi:threonyl-tRNA synthetase
MILARLHDAGLRADLDARREKVNYKIREAQLQKIPYMLVVGDQETSTEAVSVRLRTGENLGPVGVEAFIAIAKAQAESRSLELS